MADLLCPVVIGRGAETAALRSALGAAGDGAGGVVFLAGEAGIGKSRLAAELAGQARAGGMRVVAGRAVPAGAASPYRPLTEALLQGLREFPFPADDSLAPWGPALRAIVPAMPGAGGGEVARSPPVTRRRYAAKPCSGCCAAWPDPPASCSCWRTCTGPIRTRWRSWSI